MYFRGGIPGNYVTIAEATELLRTRPKQLLNNDAYFTVLVACRLRSQTIGLRS